MNVDCGRLYGMIKVTHIKVIDLIITAIGMIKITLYVEHRLIRYNFPSMN